MSRIRVLYVCAEGFAVGSPHGAGVHVAQMLRAFTEVGAPTGLVCKLTDAAFQWAPTLALRPPWQQPARPSTAQALLEYEGSALARRALRTARDFRLLADRARMNRMVQQALRDWQPELVYERYSLFGTGSIRFAHRLEIPHVLEVNAPLVEEATRHRGLELTRAARKAERASWTGTDLVVAVTPPMADKVRRGRSGPIMVASNAVASEFFTAEPLRAAVRSRLGLDRHFVVGFVGSMNPWHDLNTLVEAVGTARTQEPIALLAIGDGPIREEIESRAKELGLRAVFTGSIPHAQVPEHIAAMDAAVCGIIAQHDYGSPVKAFEYLAAGKPTIATPVGDLPALIHQNAVLAYPSEDVKALREAIQRLADDPALRHDLARRGVAVARAHTWPDVARAVLDAVSMRLAGSTEASGSRDDSGAGAPAERSERTGSPPGH